MKIDNELARSLKLAVERLFETPEGQDLIEYLEWTAGRYGPTYDPRSETQIVLEAGRRGVIATLHQMHRMTGDQIEQFLLDQQ